MFSVFVVVFGLSFFFFFFLVFSVFVVVVGLSLLVSFSNYSPILVLLLLLYLLLLNPSLVLITDKKIKKIKRSVLHRTGVQQQVDEIPT